MQRAGRDGGNATGILSDFPISSCHFSSGEGAGSRPLCTPLQARGHPGSACQAGCLPKSTWRPHTKSRGKRALESPALGFGPPPGLPQLHVNTPQQPEKEGLVSGFGLKKKKKRGFHAGSAGNSKQGPGSGAEGTWLRSAACGGLGFKPTKPQPTSLGILDVFPHPPALQS